MNESPLRFGLAELRSAYRAIAERLARTLTELADGLEDAGDGEPRYRLLLGLYLPRQPGGEATGP